MKFKLICIDGIYVGLLNGNPFVSDSLTPEQIKVLVNNPTEEQVVEIFNPKLAEVAQYNREVKEIQDILVGSGLFELKQGSYFRVGIPYSVPKLLLDKYKEKIVNGITTDALDNFWIKNAHSITKHVKEGLVDFLEKNGFVITDRGNFIAYRNVNILKEGNRKLARFITDSYLKIKGQKKSPKNYEVFKNDDNQYVLHHVDVNVDYDTHLGTLEELYQNVSEIAETVYTYAYSGSKAGRGLKSNEIRVGVPYRIDPKVVDTSETECSSGLHFCSWNYLTQHSGYALGQVKIAVLISPSDCASFPTQYNSGKGRAFGMLPLGEVTAPIERLDDIEFEDIYEQDLINEINERVFAVDDSVAPIYKLEMKEISPAVFSSIDEYADQLKFKNEYCGYYDEEE